MRVYYSLYGRLLSMEALYNGFKKVKRANGAAGIDRQSLSDFALNLGSKELSLNNSDILNSVSVHPERSRRMPGTIRGAGVHALRQAQDERGLETQDVRIISGQFLSSFANSSNELSDRLVGISRSLIVSRIY